MIVSYHPVYEADLNLNCAGRKPGQADLEAIKTASAVILPQGCSKALYNMARANCAHVFPRMDPRFDYPGKVGQARLFNEQGVDHPLTLAFEALAEFEKRFSTRKVWDIIPFPMIFKFDWGGEGETVYHLQDRSELSSLLEKAAAFERSGQAGFVIQQLVDCRNRCLRVVVIGRLLISYWRRLDADLPSKANLSQGAILDYCSAARLQETGRQAVAAFCRRTNIQLAGFDLLFSDKDLACGKIRPLFLEINYFFGRTGLGGSQNYYRLLADQIDNWLHRRGLRLASSPNSRAAKHG